MHSQADKERFIELRAEGMSYADIAQALHISKPTLIAWSKELQREVANARTLRLDTLFSKYTVAQVKRIEVFGKRLDAILAELDTRNLADVKTETLFKLALEYGDRLKDEAAPLTLEGEPVAGDPMEKLLADMNTTRDTWTP